MNSFLITGMARSGTTLLDKMLASHPDADVLSQPFPILYRHLKEVFFDKINYPKTYYVLNDLFDEKLYNGSDFTRFLEKYQINKKEIDLIFNRMRGWDGQWTAIEDWNFFLENYKSTTLNNLYKLLLRYYRSKSDIKEIGSKEVLIEEFIPYFLRNGIKVVLIVRDPRDIITSLNFGKGTKYGGGRRPTLFHLRNWRKSIAIANTFSGYEFFFPVKYESLVSNKHESLKRITNFLGLDPFSYQYFKEGIPDKKGGFWKSNSSTDQFSEINGDNFEKYKHYLNECTVKYIEKICFPEMKQWAYKANFTKIDDENIKYFKEPFTMESDTINPNLSSDESELRKEFERIDMLNSWKISNDTSMIERYFYSFSNFKQLKKLMS